MAVTNFPTSTEITNLQASSYNAGANLGTNYMPGSANPSLPNAALPENIATPHSRIKGFIEGVKQLITWLKADSPQLIQEAWVAPTLLNSWVNLAGGFATAGYYKDSTGTVKIKGLIRSGTKTAGTVFFTLPVGYRPAEDCNFSGIALTSGSVLVLAEARVAPNGNVTFQTGDNGWFSLQNIQFRAA